MHRITIHHSMQCYLIHNLPEMAQNKPRKSKWLKLSYFYSYNQQGICEYKDRCLNCQTHASLFDLKKYFQHIVAKSVIIFLSYIHMLTVFEIKFDSFMMNHILIIKVLYSNMRSMKVRTSIKILLHHSLRIWFMLLKDNA